MRLGLCCRLTLEKTIVSFHVVMALITFVMDLYESWESLISPAFMSDSFNDSA